MTVLTKYIQERFKFRVYIPLSIFLATGSEFSVLYKMNTGEAIKRTVSAFLLLLLFRLWDDLYFMEKDRIRDPERITVNPLYNGPLWIRLIMLSVFSFLFILVSYSILMTTVLIIFTLVFLSFYFFNKLLGQLFFDLLVLLKYPVIAFIISSERTPFRDKILPLIIIYLVTLVYEVFHDREHRLDRNYLIAGFIAWIFLISGFASQIFLQDGSYNSHLIKIGILFLCLGLFFAALKYEDVRNLKIIPFANGIFYLGMLIAPV